MLNLLAFIFGGAPGPVEFIIIGGIILLLFGKRLPGAMRALGKSVVEFKKGVKGIEEDSEQASTAPKKENQEHQ